MESTVVEIIKGMLAPGILISACGLLLLGMNNKYSLVVNRIRILNSEFRQLDENEDERRTSIRVQLPLLIKRMKYIRNAVWLYTVSIAMFLFTEFMLANYLINGKTKTNAMLSLAMLLVAMLSLLSGISYAAREVMLGYKIVLIESETVLGRDMAKAEN
ncbi:MAG: hypothetical protein Kow0037_25330 [Calditrichia bacterium]